MILLTLSRGKGEETVRLQLPASPAEIGETFAFLDRISLDTTATAILDVSSNVPVLYRCLYDVDVEDSEQFQKLQKLAERTEALSPAKAAIFSGALDAECVWNLEGALTVADRLDEYRFNTPEFKEVLQRFVDDLRQTGLLKNLGAMDAYCWQHGGSITEDRRSYGYIAETENYRFCLRCTPFPGEYQGYLYCYDLCQQEMYRQEHPVVGRVTFASGEQQEFTDSKALLQAIREELPFRSTTGFRFETLTDDPEVKKAVDDILLDFAGEDNSRRTCNYGLTETGKQALRKAADPSIPHTYAWFVMADTNTPQEIIRQDLTLEEAIQIYQDSNTSEKRLGVIKDGIATVDFVHFQSGEQQFFTDHEKLESFRSDLVVAEAMERLYQQLNQPDIGIRMGEM